MRCKMYTIMNLENKKISFQRFYFKKYFEIRLRCNDLSYLMHNNVDQIKQSHLKEMYTTCRMQTHPKTMLISLKRTRQNWFLLNTAKENIQKIQNKFSQCFLSHSFYICFTKEWHKKHCENFCAFIFISEGFHFIT